MVTQDFQSDILHSYEFSYPTTDPCNKKLTTTANVYSPLTRNLHSAYLTTWCTLLLGFLATSKLHTPLFRLILRYLSQSSRIVNAFIRAINRINILGQGHALRLAIRPLVKRKPSEISRPDHLEVVNRSHEVITILYCADGNLCGIEVEMSVSNNEW